MLFRSCERAGLNLIDVIKHPIHGTSYMFLISKSTTAKVRIAKLIEEEEKSGIYDPKTYYEFCDKANKLAESFASIIRSYRRSNFTIIGYSAPAKGNTLMNFAKEGPDLIFEDTPQKQETYTPGLQIYVTKPRYELVQNYNTVVWIPLAWNFYKEIKSKIETARPDKKDIFLLTGKRMWIENDEGGSKERNV